MLFGINIKCLEQKFACYRKCPGPCHFLLDYLTAVTFLHIILSHLGPIRMQQDFLQFINMYSHKQIASFATSYTADADISKMLSDLRQCQWTRHIIRMDNSHLPTESAHEEVSASSYKDALTDNLAFIDINSAELESQTTDRTSWRAFCRQSISM